MPSKCNIVRVDRIENQRLWAMYAQNKTLSIEEDISMHDIPKLEPFIQQPDLSSVRELRGDLNEFYL